MPDRGRREGGWARGVALACLLLGVGAAVAVSGTVAATVVTESGDREEHVSGGGEVVWGEHHSDEGTRRYRLFVPDASSRAGDPSRPEERPLVVMLHGCTQDPDDFAAGTRMDRHAEEGGFLVLYPEQPARVQPQRCWQWYDAAHQGRDAGEPALLAGMVREIIASRGVDARRVYVAGISAGGAMALTLTATHPDLFAAAAVHSAVPHAATGSAARAAAVMQGEGPDAEVLSGRLLRAMGDRARAVPIIVFHGADDAVVAVENARRIAAARAAAARVASARAASEAVDAASGAFTSPAADRTESGTSPGGLTYERSVWSREEGGLSMELWIVQGLGHAWSGGAPEGSYTDEAGPDASRAMLDFLLRWQLP